MPSGLHVGKFAEGVGRAVGDDFAEIDVGDVAAALGFVHVMSGDEKGDAVGGKFEEKIPELAARDGIDARGGFVEKDESGLVQHGAAESQALLPPAGKLRGETIEIRTETVELNDFVHALAKTLGSEAVDAAVENEIFGNGEIGIEAEILRHVADIFADGFGVGANVDALDGGVAGRKRKQTGEHFDDGGFAAAVGAEKAEDFAFFDAEADVVHGGEVAEAADQMVGGDGGLVGVGHGLGVGSELDVGGHAGEDAMGGIVDADFHAENLVDAFFAGLHVAGKKFGLLVDLLDDAVEGLIGKGVDADFRFLAEMHVADFGFRDVDADVDLIALEERGDGSVGRDEIAGADIENFDGGGGGGENLAFAETGFVVGQSGFRGGNIFAAIAALVFFESGLRLVIAGFGGSDFFGAIAALEFIEFVSGRSAFAARAIFQLASAVSRCCLETRSLAARAS